LRDESILAKVRQQGSWLQERLSRLAERHAVIGDVRGMGLMWGIELVDPQAKDSHGRPAAAGSLAGQVKRACFDAGLIIESGGRDGSVLRFLPPLIITDAQLNQAIDTLDQVLATQTDI
jgi:diaminobutyrate-2-oxoglutarate transaminase